jgi:Fur family ferric uptake transcriptional regulator
MQGDNPIQLFKRYLKAKGLNVTRSRERILEEVFKTHEHFDATELWARLRDTTISLSTIYRTLGLLVDSGLVREVDLGDAHIHYEHIFGRRHHEHLICVGCGKVLEFFDRALEEKVLEMAERFDFQHHSHNLQIFGLCQDCQKKGAKL